MNMKKSASDIFRLEHEMVAQCGISKERFHKVSGNQWENIYQKIVEKYADKTKIWKNGFHWANTNGYSPKSMKKISAVMRLIIQHGFIFCLKLSKRRIKWFIF